jgi:hypothetical protein
MITKTDPVIGATDVYESGKAIAFTDAAQRLRYRKCHNVIFEDCLFHDDYGTDTTSEVNNSIFAFAECTGVVRFVNCQFILGQRQGIQGKQPGSKPGFRGFEFINSSMIKTRNVNHQTGIEIDNGSRNSTEWAASLYGGSFVESNAYIQPLQELSGFFGRPFQDQSRCFTAPVGTKLLTLDLSGFPIDPASYISLMNREWSVYLEGRGFMSVKPVAQVVGTGSPWASVTLECTENFNGEFGVFASRYLPEYWGSARIIDSQFYGKSDYVGAAGGAAVALYGVNGFEFVRCFGTDWPDYQFGVENANNGLFQLCSGKTSQNLYSMQTTLWCDDVIFDRCIGDCGASAFGNPHRNVIARQCGTFDYLKNTSALKGDDWLLRRVYPSSGIKNGGTDVVAQFCYLPGDERTGKVPAL